MDSEERECLENNEIPVDSISLGSEDEEGEEEDDGSDLDSFIASDEPLELMTSDDEVEKKEKKADLKKKRKRIIKLDSSTDEENDDKPKTSAVKSEKLEEIDLLTEESDDNVVKMASNKSHVTITSTDAESSVFEESKILDNTGKQENEDEDQTKPTDVQLPEAQKASDVTEETEKALKADETEVNNEVIAPTSVAEKEANTENLSLNVNSAENDKIEDKSSDEKLSTEEVATEISQIPSDVSNQEVPVQEPQSQEKVEKVDVATNDEQVPEVESATEISEEKPSSDLEIKDSSLETSVDSNSNKKIKKTKKFDMSNNWVEEDIVPEEASKLSRKSLPAVLHDITAVSIDKNKRKTIATSETVILKEKVKQKRKAAIATTTTEKIDEKSPPKKKKGDAGEAKTGENIEMTFDNDKLLAKCNEFLRQKKEKKRENRLLHKKKKVTNGTSC